MKIALATVAVLVVSTGVVGAIVYGPDIINPPPPEDEMLAQAQQSVVTINVVGDHFTGSGSGFFLDDSGRILTNYHVIENAWKVTVTTRGGATVAAQLVSYDSGDDLAELEVPVSGPKLTLRQEPAKVGEQVYVLGNPGGTAPNSTSKGTVSKIHVTETVEGRTYTDLGATDALTKPGDSGGPVVDRRGHVVGVIAVGSQITGEGGFILDSIVAPDLSRWTSFSTLVDFKPPPPAILVTESNFDGQCDPGCPMHATVTNRGGPGTAIVTFVIDASNKTTVLATCTTQVTLNKGDTVTTRCVVSSSSLTNYFYVPYSRQVWGNASVTSQTPIAI